MGKRFAPEPSDPVGPLEVRGAEDVEEFGAGSGTEGVDSFPYEGRLAKPGDDGRLVARQEGYGPPSAAAITPRTSSAIRSGMIGSM